MKRLALVLALASCATTRQPVVTSGQVLLEAGKQFEVTGGAMYRGCSTGKIPAQTCSSWATFATRFKPAYKAAVAAWSVGATLGAGDAGVDWAVLSGELADFTAALVAAAFVVDGGAP